MRGDLGGCRRGGPRGRGGWRRGDGREHWDGRETYGLHRRRWRRNRLGFGLGRRGGRGAPDLAEQSPGANRLAILGGEFSQGAGRRCVDFERYLVGFKFDDWFVR